MTTLADVIREAKRSVAEWPEWMREAAKEVVEHFERRSTGNEVEEATRRIDELSSKLHEREKLLREIDAFMSFRPVVPAEQTKKIQQSIREALGDE